jgi:hypothetical protein
LGTPSNIEKHKDGWMDGWMDDHGTLSTPIMHITWLDDLKVKMNSIIKYYLKNQPKRVHS